MSITLRMAWRNLWRNKRRTWLTVGAMIFSNLLLVFLISLQFGSYRMMIDNTLRTAARPSTYQNWLVPSLSKSRSTWGSPISVPRAACMDALVIAISITSC